MQAAGYESQGGQLRSSPREGPLEQSRLLSRSARRRALPDLVGLLPHFSLGRVSSWTVVPMGLRKVFVASLQGPLGPQLAGSSP